MSTQLFDDIKKHIIEYSNIIQFYSVTDRCYATNISHYPIRYGYASVNTIQFLINYCSNGNLETWILRIIVIVILLIMLVIITIMKFANRH